MKQSFDLRKNMQQEEEKEGVRVVFMGTDEYGGAILSALLSTQYNLAAVFTKPDRSVGRQSAHTKRLSTHNPVKEFAISNNITLFQPEKLDADTAATLREIAPEVVIVASYGKIIPADILATAKKGFINVHASLLPRLRGASPIQNALLLGEKETGTTIMLMDDGVDTGDILAQEKMALSQKDTTATLFPRMAQHGADLFIKTLPQWLDGTLTPQKQDDKNATLCQLIDRQDGHIQWDDDALSIYNRYRALTPWPGIFGFWKKDGTTIVRVKFHDVTYDADDHPDHLPPGTVFRDEQRIGIQTLDGVLYTETIQIEAKKGLLVPDFLNGNQNFIGTQLQ